MADSFGNMTALGFVPEGLQKNSASKNATQFFALFLDLLDFLLLRVFLASMRDTIQLYCIEIYEHYIWMDDIVWCQFYLVKLSISKTIAKWEKCNFRSLKVFCPGCIDFELLTMHINYALMPLALTNKHGLPEILWRGWWGDGSVLTIK